MYSLALVLCLFAQPATEAGAGSATKADVKLAPLRKLYRDDAEKYQFQLEQQGQPALELVRQPIMRWTNDDDWSGDVFVWAAAKRPAIVGCILSGPASDDNRLVFHEFHLISDAPLAPTAMQTGRRWQPKSGLKVEPVPDAPAPARTAPGRLTQMRHLSREFTAHMRADSDWELRLLPQPLYRYGDEKSDVIDGALFAYVWTKGTDPEVILLIECRKTADGNLWNYAPVRFSNRSVWLQYAGKEVWHVENHQEPDGKSSDRLYTTAYANTVPRPTEADVEKSTLPKPIQAKPKQEKPMPATP